MRGTQGWTDRIPDRDNLKSVCYDIAYRPDGTQLVTGIGNRVLVYDAADGDVLYSLKGHKDTVYCVAYARDGKRFASGGADKTIIIWTSAAEGLLKYSHNDSIQALAYNPVTHALASGTASDFGLWSPEAKSVVKHRVQHKVLSLAWTNDGQWLALGHSSGHVSIRDRLGAERTVIERSAPVWTIAWSPSREEVDTLAVGCWDGTLSFYTLTSGVAQQVGKDKDLGCDPTSVSFLNNGLYLAIAGTDRKVTVVTRDGTTLAAVVTRPGAWLWAARPRPKGSALAVGADDGSITSYNLNFSTVHGLYADRYAYRDNMTEVIIQHLLTEQKSRIKCRDYVKKIAVYKDRLAVQLPDKVMIYELVKDDPDDMQYRLHKKIPRKLDCNLLVVTAEHIILCLEKKLQLYNFAGVKEREWVLDAVIRYIKVVGGPPCKEGLLVGLKSGHVVKIFVNNQFPVSLVEHPHSIRCLDVSASRGKLALVDDKETLHVYDLASRESTFSAKGVNSVAWNADAEDMLAFSGGGVISVKTADLPLHTQKLPGFVVGFKGSKAFCLHYVAMQTVDVPQGAAVRGYLAQRDYASAYRMACLGVTESDWAALGRDALQGMALDVARKAFIRVKDVRSISLLDRLEARRRRTGAKGAAGDGEGVFLAEVLAYQGRFQDAARAFARAGQPGRALEMFTDLRQFEEAQAWASEHALSAPRAGAPGGGGLSVESLMQRQAEWSEETNDHATAADMYLKAGRFDKAVAVIAKHQWADKLAEVVRTVAMPEHARVLEKCAGHFRRWGKTALAREAYVKLGAYKDLASLLVEAAQKSAPGDTAASRAKRWEEATAVASARPELRADVYLPYGRWLAEHDRFEEARGAYVTGGKPDQATRLLSQLAASAARERRHAAAARFYWLLAREALAPLALATTPPPSGPAPPPPDPTEAAAAMAAFASLYDLSEIHHAQSVIHRCLDEPFRTTPDSVLLAAGRFLCQRLTAREEAPPGTSLAYALQVVARFGESLGAHKLARGAYSRLQSLRLAPTLAEDVDVACLVARSRPLNDREELLPACPRCGAPNPLSGAAGAPMPPRGGAPPVGDACVSCGGSLVRSALTFDVLGLVEFECEPGVTHPEFLATLGAGGGGGGGGYGRVGADPGNDAAGGMGSLIRDDTPAPDPFSPSMLALAEPGRPLVLSRAQVGRLSPGEVVVRTWPWPPGPVMRPQYFKLMSPDDAVVADATGHFFESEELDRFLSDHAGAAPFLGTGAADAAPPPAAAATPAAAPSPAPPPADDLEVEALVGTTAGKDSKWGAARSLHMVRGALQTMGEEAAAAAAAEAPMPARGGWGERRQQAPPPTASGRPRGV